MPGRDGLSAASRGCRAAVAVGGKQAREDREAILSAREHP